MKKIASVNIVGTGNVAQALYRAMKGKVTIRGVYAHSGRIPKVFSKSSVFLSLADLATDADLTIICVSDDAIKTVAERLPVSMAVVHTSGAVSIDVLSKFKKKGVLYPLQTFSSGRRIEFAGVPVLIEAGDKNFLGQLKSFSKNYLSDNVYVLGSDDRLNLHAAAVFVNNFTTYLLGVAESMTSGHKLPQILKPLAQETIDKFFDLGYLDSQTGPARRGDKKTMKRHLELIENKTDSDIYRLISKAIAARFNP